MFIVQAYHTSEYVVPRGGIFLGKWRRSFAGNSDGKMNVQSACLLSTRYYSMFLGLSIFLGYIHNSEGEGFSRDQCTRLHRITVEGTIIQFVAVFVKIL
jgi:hypothetical protein